MKPALMVGSVLILAGLLFLDFRGYQSLIGMRADLRQMQQEIVETRELAERGSSAAQAASTRADEARRGAEAAAGQRQQAEAARMKAEADKQAADQAKTAAMTTAQQAQKRMEDMRREREEELNHMQEALNRIVETKRTPTGMVMVLPNSVFRFEFDSADLQPQNRELLSRIAGVLLVSKGYGLAVHGYTDDVGSAEYNKQLSLRRAKAVADYLGQAGVDRKIMSVEGYGKSDPRVRGTTAEGRAQNRRVEIALTDSSIQYLGEAPGAKP